MSPDVVKAVERLQRLLITEARNHEEVVAEGYSDEVLRRVRPVLTTRWIEKARAHLDHLLRSAPTKGDSHG